MSSNGKPNRSVTLAILPFENLSQGNDLEIICQSFSFDLTTELSRFKQFRIIAPDSIEQIKEEDGLGLDIDYHIKGSFRAGKESVRINAQLIASKSRHLVWADRFKGTKDQVLEIQDDLLKKVVSNLQQQLNYNLLSQIREKPKIKLKAYECWLYGMNEVKKGSVKNDIKAREYFQQAIKEEPHFSLAYSGMSLTYFNEWSCQLWERWDVSQSQAFKWANKAIELDEQNYVAALVLGRVLMYEGSYETAEHYIRKSLMLNPNDADNLIDVASCLTYLGYPNEAYEIYQKAQTLNPAGKDSYYATGALILLEMGENEKAKELAQKTHHYLTVDTPACFAAIHYYLGEVEQSEIYWQQYLELYRQKINKDQPFEPIEAVEWMIKVNPYKHKTKQETFWKFKSEARAVDQLLQDIVPTGKVIAMNVFQKQADFWDLSYDGIGVQLAEVKGFYDLEKLLKHPGQPIHCAELMGITINTARQPLIDEKARAEYQNKIRNLQQEISQADQNNDLEVLSNLQQEYDDILEHLSSSLGLSGKIREAGNPIEKARSAVTWRIRNAISKIEKVHPAMGKHLSHAVNTGTFCVYDPENKVEWILG